MAVALFAALLFAQATAAAPVEPVSYGPAAPAPPKPAPAKAAEQQCTPQTHDPKSDEILVCAIKPEGYRIDPDVLAARKMKKKGDAGQPRNPHETYADHSCTNVGPMGCRGGPTIDLAAAAVTAATMIGKAVKGENVGQMFVTEPDHPSEYQLYQQAKREREEKEAVASAKAISDAAKNKSAADAATAAQASQQEQAAPQE